MDILGDMINIYPKNAKFHSPEQIEAIAKSIKRFGWQSPIKVGHDNVIVTGHGRFFAFEKFGTEFGLKPMWIIDKEGKTISGGPEEKVLSEKEEKAFRIADNKIASMTELDQIMVKEELLEMDDQELLETTGYDQEFLEADEFNFKGGGEVDMEDEDKNSSVAQRKCPNCQYLL